MYILFIYVLYFSGACTIELNDKVVVTGGVSTGNYFSEDYYVRRLVSVYNIGGWLEDLPDLNIGREQHGCGHYVDNNNNMVIINHSYLIVPYR